MRQGIDRMLIRNMNDYVGYGYVVLPRNVDRRDYVQTVYNKEKLSILPDQGSSFIHDCYISRSALRDIVFPQTNEELGSAVVYVCNQFNNKPFVIGVISKETESQLLREYGFMFTKTFNNNKVTLEANAEVGNVVISVNNMEDAASVLLNCIGRTGTNFTINCNGTFFASIDNSINVTTRQNITLRSENAEQTEESTIVINNNNVTVTPNERFNVGTGAEPLAKGTELVNQLNATNSYLSTLVNAISTALSTIDGTAGSVSAAPFNSTMSAVSPGNYSDVNSEISYTD